MKISELINELQRQQRMHGDVRVGMIHEWTEEVEIVQFVPEQQTGFANNADGVEYVHDHILLSGGAKDTIFYRKKQ